MDRESNTLRQFSSWRWAQISRTLTLSMASQDSVLLNALLCSASAGLFANTDNATHKIASIYFKRQAIQHLDQVIRSLGKETVHISTAFSVSLLLWTEVSPLFTMLAFRLF